LADVLNADTLKVQSEIQRFQLTRILQGSGYLHRNKLITANKYLGSSQLRLLLYPACPPPPPPPPYPMSMETGCSMVRPESSESPKKSPLMLANI